MIGNCDMSQLTNDVTRIIEYSQNYPPEVLQDSFGIRNILVDWAYAKRDFIRLFGNKLILPCGYVRAKISADCKDVYFDEFIKKAQSSGLLKQELYNFILKNKDGFFDNLVTSPHEELNIDFGSKLLKSFKKFNDTIDEVRKLQDLASCYIQKDKLEGYLYISVDPRDYLTISDNNNNWHSCHSLDSDYRLGNLEYMVDHVTLVAYLTEREDDMQKLKCMPDDMTWNSKIWRMLVHVNTDGGIYYGRQYPLSSIDILMTVDNAIRRLYPDQFLHPAFVSFNECGQNQEFSLFSNHFFFNNNIISSEDCIDYSSYHGYQDLCSTASQVYFAPKESIVNKMRLANCKHERRWMHHLFDIKIGESVHCVSCGALTAKDGSSMLCPKCRVRFNMDL